MAETIAENIMLRIVEETKQHNTNIEKQLASDKNLLGKLISQHDKLTQRQEESDVKSAEYQSTQSKFSEINQAQIKKIEENPDQKPELQTGEDDTRTDAPLGEQVNVLIENLDKSQADIVEAIGFGGYKQGQQKHHEDTLEETKETKKNTKDALDILNETQKDTLAATVKGWAQSFKDTVKENAKLSKFTSRVGEDFSLMTGHLQTMTSSIPFYKTITGLLKWIGASLLLLAKNWITARMGPMMEGMVQGIENLMMTLGMRDKESIQEARDKRKELQEAHKKKKADKKEEGDKPGLKSKIRDRLKDRSEKRQARKQSNKGAFKKGMDSGKEGSDKRTKTGRKTQKQFKGMTKSMGTMGKIMANIGRALSVAVSVLSGIMTGFVAAMTAAGVTIGAVTIPVWGVVAIVIIIIALIAGLIYWLYLKWEEIGEWWDRMKVHMAAAMERMMLWKDKAVNWFSDMGTRLGFMIRRIIAVLLDGIAGALNYAIELFNAIPLVPDVDWRMEEGRVDEVDEQRAAFEVESKKRGEELERRGKALDVSKDEKMQAVLDQQSGANVNQQINNTSNNNSNQDVSIGTGVSDSYADGLQKNNV